MIHTYREAVDVALAAIPDVIAEVGLPLTEQGFEDAEGYLVSFELPPPPTDPDLVVMDGGGDALIVDKLTGEISIVPMWEAAPRVDAMTPTTK